MLPGILFVHSKFISLFSKNKSRLIAICLLIGILSSCDKVNVTLDDGDTIDPNITYFDNYKTEIATYKPDSFLTSSHKIFCIGTHTDPVFGKITASSYAQIALPLSNKVRSQDVLFDSLELILKSTGSFYGDSSLPFRVSAYQLTENIENTVSSNMFFNTTRFQYNPVPIGQQTFNLYGRTGEIMHLRLSDILGNDLLNKFKDGDDAITTEENFINYFKGILISPDNSVTNTVGFFNAATDTALIRLHYHKNVVYSDPGYMDLNFTSTKQFSHISFDYNASLLAGIFLQNTHQLISSTDSYGQSFLNNNLGSSIKISFPTLLDLKELHPYIKVIKAELLIKPDKKSYQYPYQLPQTLYLYTTDATNSILGYVPDPVNGGIQSGSLFVDHLYAENTSYSFDITSFINTKITEGSFSTSALLLSTSFTTEDAGSQRLIINDQSVSNGIQLKLYLLGL